MIISLAYLGQAVCKIARYGLTYSTLKQVGSNAWWSNVAKSESDYSQSFLNIHLLEGKREDTKVHSLIKQEGESKVLLRKHGATADEKRMREFPYRLDALIKFTHTADTLQLPAQSL